MLLRSIQQFRNILTKEITFLEVDAISIHAMRGTGRQNCIWPKWGGRAKTKHEQTAPTAAKTEREGAPPSTPAARSDAVRFLEVDSWRRSRPFLLPSVVSVLLSFFAFSCSIVLLLSCFLLRFSSHHYCVHTCVR